MTYISQVPTTSTPPIPNASYSPGPLKSYFRRVFAELPTSARGHVVAFIGEFIGTISFLTFAFAGGSSAAASANAWADGDEVNTKAFVSSPQLLLFVAFSAGLSLIVNAWIFFRISGGLFNPAV